MGFRGGIWFEGTGLRCGSRGRGACGGLKVSDPGRYLLPVEAKGLLSCHTYHTETSRNLLEDDRASGLSDIILVNTMSKQVNNPCNGSTHYQSTY